MNHPMPTFYFEQMNAKVALACDSTEFEFVTDVKFLNSRELLMHVEFLTNLLTKVCVQKGWHLQGQTLTNGEYHTKRYTDYFLAETTLLNRIDRTTTELFNRLQQTEDSLAYQQRKANDK